MTLPRNVLLIMADQLRWDCLSCYGDSLVSTANIDQLAKEGLPLTGPIANLPYAGLPACLFTQAVIHSHTGLLGMEFL